MTWTRKIPIREIQERVTAETISFAEEFGTYLAEKDNNSNEDPLTTTQLRRFFGEVKRQQITEYDETEFVMLKPKLAYAVGRAKKSGKEGRHQKIEDFYTVLADAIDNVVSSPNKPLARKNFTTAFEAIVAYHKAAEKK